MNKKLKLFTCMGCGFKIMKGVFTEDYCDICDWEESISGMISPFKSPFMHGKTLYTDYQQKVLHKIPYKIKEYKGFKRNPLWRPICEERFDKKYDYFPTWKFGEFISKYPKYSSNKRKIMKEAQKHNPDDKVHMTNEEIIQKGLW